MQNTVNWFELFVTDLNRAQAFYEEALGTTLKSENFMGEPHAIFKAEGVAGALVVRKERKPSAEGALVYLACNGRLDAVLGRVEKAGGRVLLGKTEIGPPGFIAIISDTEGNQVGLHSPR